MFWGGIEIICYIAIDKTIFYENTVPLGMAISAGLGLYHIYPCGPHKSACAQLLSLS